MYTKVYVALDKFTACSTNTANSTRSNEISRSVTCRALGDTCTRHMAVGGVCLTQSSSKEVVKTQEDAMP